MDPLLPEEKEAFKLLNNIGLEVKSVPTGKTKSPEFIVDGDGRGYVIEVKARRDSEEWEKRLREGNAALESRSTGFGRWSGDVTKNSLKQLNAVDPQHSRWWVLWFSIECQASRKTMFQQVIGSLFGVRQVVDRCTGAMWDCLYAKTGVFERHSEIVAVVVTEGRLITLCVNELAKDYNSFTHSVLYKSFERLGPINSATELTKNRNFLCIDPKTVDRKDEGALSKYIEEKHNLKAPILLDMKEHTATVKVPKSHS